jgi:hypothetical protein
MHAAEDALSSHLEHVLDSGQIPDLEIARAAVAPVPNAVPALNLPPPDIKAYDSLLANAPHPPTPLEIN